MNSNKTIATIIASILVLITAFGCTDDETNPIAATDIDYMIVGQVILRPYVDFLGSIHPIHGQELDIDSVLFGDSLCNVSKAPSYVDGNNYHYSFGYTNRSDSNEYRSGDIVAIKFYRGSEVATATVKLLEINLDSVQFVSPLRDTVAVSETFTLTWNKSVTADWYGVTVRYDTSYAFGSEGRQWYRSTADTTFTIQADSHSDDGRYRVFVTAISGPMPGQPGNVSSKSMTGTIYGSAIPGFREGVSITVGDGPSPAN